MEDPSHDLQFEILTPLGFRVRVGRAYWEFLIRIKHPVMAGREGDVRMALEYPMKFAEVGLTLTCYYSIRLRKAAVGYVLFVGD
jgi:hypothetical protein